ncbi:hypothetical protein B0I35DRAFT_434488 [Stachybotrys elegans]|uniref:Uncharacterized protein n=1 Tax=Stachybotrys elegans TaxID=80388 RepID=A0A8K0SRM6_9HYPO|nr:hypothetical protein B0I35DRAFT_434488 [Stachybotrys elegans]
MPNYGDHDDLLEGMLTSLLGDSRTGLRGQLRTNLVTRGNTPSKWEDNLWRYNRRRTETLWVVDRLIGPQMMANFASFMGWGVFPDGTKTDLQLLDDEAMMALMTPASQWAPAPYNQPGRSTMDNLMVRVGSFEDGGRMHLISKNLEAAKSRIWAGVSPMSDRRWKEKKLYEPQNFHEACQLITEVLTVFRYLNEPQVRMDLRATYNVMWDDLKAFENALNAKRRAQGKAPTSPTSLWAAYMRKHYALMEARSHAWIADKIAKMRERIISELAAHQPSEAALGTVDNRQWELTDQWQDLSENLAQADYAIFLPMDGYKGCASPSATGLPIQPNVEYFGTTRLMFTPELDARMKHYHLRRRHIDMMAMMNDAVMNPGDPNRPMYLPADLARSSVRTARSQDSARLELRGQPYPRGQESFVSVPGAPWGFVAYRAHYGHGDAEWQEFKAKFEADISDWGEGLVGVDDKRAQTNIHWLDARELGLAEDDTGALRKHFDEFSKTSEFPKSALDAAFLVADKASIESYLKPIPKPARGLLPAGDFGGFILAVDPSYDPNGTRERADESPGYDGTVRVLGSVLWDDVCAFMAVQAHFLDDLWRAAMDHPLGVYVGLAVKQQVDSWKVMGRIGKVFASSYMKWEEERGQRSAPPS